MEDQERPSIARTMPPGRPGASDSSRAAATERFGPVKPRERIELLDVLRGFAVLGILFVNNDVAGYHTEILFPSALEQFGHSLIFVLGRGTLWPLFAVLYGVGFAIQLERAEARGKNIIPAYLRRQFFLVLICCCLLLLAINVVQLLRLASHGVPMLFIGYFLRRRRSFWLLVAVVVLVAPGLGMGIRGYFERNRGLSGRPDIVAEEVTNRIEEVRSEFRERAERDAERAARWNLDEFGQGVREIPQFFAVIPLFLVLSWNPNFLAFMLIGIFLWRIGVLREPAKHRRFFLLLLSVSLQIGLMAAIYANAVWHSGELAELGLGAYPTPLTQIFFRPIGFIASVCMPLAYIAGFALLGQLRVWSRVLNALVPVGRTALTNYALQALLPALLFGHYTPGISKWTLGVWLTIAVLIPMAGLQVVFSRVWLRSYLFGPLEWLWRSLTYWKLQPMRVTSSTPTV